MAFWNKKSGEGATSTGSRPASSDTHRDPNLIRVFDKFGREAFVTKEDWRAKVLPGTLQSAWNDSEQLYGVIVGALRDGFFQDVLGAAEHLRQLEPSSSRAACAYGIVLSKTGQIAKAEDVFRDYLERYGDDGSVLTNLAKVYSSRGENQKVEETLWRGLKCDPNQDNGLMWYVAIHRERDGDDATLAALRRIATLSGSWRPQLWLARAALQSGDLGEAINHYRDGLAHLGNDVPPDFLIQMSGDLGRHGHLSDSVKLTEPNFVPRIHGLSVGNNLIKAHLDLGEIGAAKTILNELYSLKRPDWNTQLGFWDTEIAKSRISKSEAKPTGPSEVTFLAVDGPVWLNPRSPATALFAHKVQTAPIACFLGSSAKTSGDAEEGPQLQLAGASGRFSRALPLFLAEQVGFASQLNTVTFIPWIRGKGFVLSGLPWRDEDAVNHSRISPIWGHYVIVTHLDVGDHLWTVNLRLLRVADRKCLGTFQTEFPVATPEHAIRGLSAPLLALLSQEPGFKSQKNNSAYQVPEGALFSNYLLRLEQLLAVRCASLEDIHRDFLSGERDIINGMIQLCLECPRNIGTRILLAQTLLAMRKVRADVNAEFVDKVLMLQRDKPLPRLSQDTVDEMLKEAFKLGPSEHSA